MQNFSICFKYNKQTSMRIQQTRYIALEFLSLKQKCIIFGCVRMQKEIIRQVFDGSKNNILKELADSQYFETEKRSVFQIPDISPGIT